MSRSAALPTPVLALLVWLAFGAPLAGCSRAAKPIGVEMRSVTRFETEWSRYRALEPRKAIAVAGDVTGLHVSGYAFGLPTDQLAVEAALESCEQRRADRRVAAACTIYAVGEEVVAETRPGR